jgi:hypothetical protein
MVLNEVIFLFNLKALSKTTEIDENLTKSWGPEVRVEAH